MSNRAKGDIPTLDEWVKAATRLAGLVRDAFNNPGSVKRDTLKRALLEFERCDRDAL